METIYFYGGHSFMYKIMLIDDDKKTLQINKKYLESDHFQVFTYDNPLKAIKELSCIIPDCIVLDVMMPALDGFAACKKMRTITKAPIIFLTGRTSEEDKIKGLVLGGDDYLIKPYSLRELSVRIKVNIRRTIAYSKPDNMLSFPPLSINTITHEVMCNDEEIKLSNREYELLAILIDKPNELITFEEISNSLWGGYSSSDRQSIMVNMSRLRKKFSMYDGLENYIETVWSKGYIFKFRQR